jgi:hypothetical protein
MNPVLVINALTAGISLVEQFYPQFLELQKQGLVSPEDQAKVAGLVDSIRSGAAFNGPQWKPFPTE